MNYALEPRRIIMWALTYRCNMSCDYCFLKDKVHIWEELSREEAMALTKEIAENTQWKPDAIWLTGGEPTIIEWLPEIINILESNNIKCVVTTNGLCCKAVLQRVISANPRGITVSLETSNYYDYNGSFSFDLRAKVKESLLTISSTKNSNTILGVSCVLFPESIPFLYEFASNLREMGVEYLSMNPLIGHGKVYKPQDFYELSEQLNKISERIDIKVPSPFFFSLVKQYYLSESLAKIRCPAATSYYFISPWGEWFPCSDEKWQNSYQYKKLKSCTVDYNKIKNHLFSIYHLDSISFADDCFSDRCIGCWKLYYDTIFTNNK